MVVTMLLMVKGKLIVVMVLLRVVADVNVSRDFSYIINGCNCVINTLLILVLAVFDISNDCNIVSGGCNGVSVLLEFIVVVIVLIVVLALVGVINYCNYVINDYIDVSSVHVYNDRNGNCCTEQFRSCCNTCDIYSGDAQIES